MLTLRILLLLLLLLLVHCGGVHLVLLLMYLYVRRLVCLHENLLLFVFLLALGGGLVIVLLTSVVDCLLVRLKVVIQTHHIGHLTRVDLAVELVIDGEVARVFERTATGGAIKTVRMNESILEFGRGAYNVLIALAALWLWLAVTQTLTLARRDGST